MPKRYVKIGRRPLKGPIQIGLHWAVQVEHKKKAGSWYEIRFTNKNEKKCDIVESYGNYSKSGAGKLGGEYVGKTNKTDEKIEEWKTEWLKNNPDYSITDTNCQKFAIEFIAWLTLGQAMKSILFVAKLS